MNKGKNPYLTTKRGGPNAPLLLRVPVHDFESNHEMEEQLLPYELLVARIRNPNPTGFTHNVGLVYKDDLNRVHSIMFMQHHGELKDTPENKKLLSGEANGNEGTGQSGQEEAPGKPAAEDAHQPGFNPGVLR